MPYGRTGYRCSSQGTQTSGTLQASGTIGCCPAAAAWRARNVSMRPAPDAVKSVAGLDTQNRTICTL